MTLGQHISQLVAIGSSAGGIEALSRVVSGLPADLPTPIVIAQHLDPRQPSHLADILARHSPLPVKVVDAGCRLENGVIFVVPPNRHVEVVDHELRLLPARRGKVAPSVDLLLSSAATVFGSSVIGLILTGTGSDGSMGARRVKEAGGTVVIENPLTAAYPSMPGSIPPSLIDVAADLDEIGAVLVDLLAADDHAADEPEGDELASLLARIRDRSGIDFATYKPATIMRRLRGRMNATKIRSLAEYERLVARDGDEYDRLVSSLLIKVTDFFRDPKVFAYLSERVLPELVTDAQRSGGELRVWCAGCSTGEEAYSLAISIAEVLSNGPAVTARIFATDVDRSAIALARRGLYPAGALTQVPTAILDRYFVNMGEAYEVTKPLRAMVTFGEHDLGARAPFPRIDLVLCRNVLIYFTTAMQRAALETFAFSLRTGGRLVLGLSETTAALPEAFAEEHGRFRVFRRVSSQLDAPPSRRPSSAARHPRPGLDTIRATRREDQHPVDSSSSAEKILLQLSVGVVVVDPRYYVVSINTSARRLLGIHGKAFGQDFIHLADALPSNELRPAIDAALAGKSTKVTLQADVMSVEHDGPRFVRLVARPTRGPAGTIDAVVVEVTDTTEIEGGRMTQARDHARVEKATALNRRLARANEELSGLVAELRSANQAMLQSSEEGQAAREEVETLNEEFQASNEELETLNEELTATVEELRIANEDLAARTDELRLQGAALASEKQHHEEEADRLRSVFASLGDAVVAVDREGQPVATNVAYDQMFGESALFAPEDLAGLPLPRDDWPQRRAARGERFRMHFALRQPDKGRRWFEAVAEPLAAGDRTWGGVVAIRDLSERTLRLSLERLMAEAGHELKTPAAAVQNYLQLVGRALEAGNADKAAGYASKALAQTRRLGALVERLLDMSRIQSGRLDLVLESVDLDAIVHSAVDIALMLPGAPEIRLSVPDAPVRLRADPARLEQVFLNLLINAIEHAPGSKSIDVTVRTSGRRARVDVRDHGRGIPADLLPTVFEAYTRREPATTTTGLGLGLFVAREIVAAHGGEITVSSREGEGTTMTVRLPLTRSVPRRPAGARPAGAR